MDWNSVMQVLVFSGEYVGTQRYVERLRPYLTSEPSTRYWKGAKKFVEGFDEMQAARRLDAIDRELQQHVVAIGELLNKKEKSLPRPKEKIELIK
jgi:hypothetical protein